MIQVLKSFYLQLNHFLVAIILLFNSASCSQFLGKDDLDPNKTLGALLHLYPFLLPNSKELKFFYFPNTQSYGIINGINIRIHLPYNTDLTNQVPNFFHNGRSISKNGIVQVPNETAGDFRLQNIYDVSANDNSIKEYSIYAETGLSTSNSLLNFQFDSLDARGVIIGTNVTVYVPFGTDLSSLVPTFSHSGVRVYAVDGGVQGAEQIPRVTARNFTTTTVYRVQAFNASNTDYVVNVIAGSQSSNSIERIAVEGIIGTIDGDTITVNLPRNKDLTQASIVIAQSGKEIRINNQVHVNGETLYNLRNIREIEIVSASGEVKRYQLIVGVTTLPGSTIPSFSNNLNGSITDNNTGLVWMRCIISNVAGVPRTGEWCTDTAIGNYPYCNSSTDDCNGGSSTGSYGVFVGGSSESTNTAWRACNLANTNPSGGYAGRTNWRVPSINELQTIIDSSGQYNGGGFGSKPYREYFPMGSGSGQYNFYIWTSNNFTVGNTLSFVMWGTTSAIETQTKNTPSAVRCVSSP